MTSSPRYLAARSLSTTVHTLSVPMYVDGTVTPVIGARTLCGRDPHRQGLRPVDPSTSYLYSWGPCLACLNASARTASVTA